MGLILLNRNFIEKQYISFNIPIDKTFDVSIMQHHSIVPEFKFYP
jgi:hypothetical protein